MNCRKISWKRLSIILSAGLVCVVCAYMYRRSQSPAPAPQHVQESGRKILRNELAEIRDTDFGRSRRGRLLTDRVESLLEGDRIIFSSDTDGNRAIWTRALIGPETLYVKVLEPNSGTYLHQLPCQIVEVTFHEAVHSIHGGFRCASIEEECDAFAAGLTAEAVSKGTDPPKLLKIDGMPVGTFVTRSYPGLQRKPGYQPLGKSLDWLKQNTGLQ
ncbi:hypothetical protein ACFLQR_05030 [Verrucomicrobiota bacterium]